MSRPPFDAPSAADVLAVSAQLGRPARDVIGIAARTGTGVPVVVSTAPRLSDGTPFPTIYYLCHPAATAAMSRLEAAGVMNELNRRLADDDGLRADYAAAHRSYIADRESVLVIPELGGVSAGGMPDRVKCLHALAAHALAAGPGVNPIGDIVLAMADWSIADAPAAPELPEAAAGADSR